MGGGHEDQPREIEQLHRVAPEQEVPGVNGIEGAAVNADAFRHDVMGRRIGTPPGRVNLWSAAA